MADLQKAIATLADITSRRRIPAPAGNIGYPHSFVELVGGRIVPMLATPPDPITFRGSYYYNTNTNRLYRRLITTFRPRIGIIKAQWKLVSQ